MSTLAKLFAHHSESPLSPLKISDSLVQLFSAERRPKFLGNEQFAVGNLPYKKIADPKFTARADEQIRIREVSR